jgi:hypothetical protein
MTRLSLSLAIVLLAACSSTSSGQTGSSSGGSSSGSTSSSGGSSSGSGGSCPNIAGTWRVTGACGSDSCVITQTNCSTNYSCSDGAASYTGSVSGNSVSYSGTSADGIPGTCTGTLDGTTLTGTCNTGDIMCAFTATKQ